MASDLNGQKAKTNTKSKTAKKADSIFTAEEKQQILQNFCKTFAFDIGVVGIQGSFVTWFIIFILADITADEFKIGGFLLSVAGLALNIYLLRYACMRLYRRFCMMVGVEPLATKKKTAGDGDKDDD